MSDIRIGLLSFSDGRQRVHEGLRPGILAHQERVAAAIRHLGVEPVMADEVIWRPRLAVAAARKMLASDVAAVVFNIPVFAFPNFSVIAANLLGKPIAILSPGESHLPGMGGLLAAAGAMAQLGLFVQRIWGPLDREEVAGQLRTFVRAAAARHRLRGQVYGQMGGRSIGMMTGVASSAADWHRVFGVDMDHVDQSEILRQAALIGEGERTGMVGWLEKNFGAVEYAEGSKLTRQTLGFQAACAAAVKKIAAEREFDFVGIKCHYDLSEYHCTQCLSAALLPFDLDWDGPRPPMVCACEADDDGAITMQILQLLTGRPALFMDLRHYDVDRGLWTLCNCGGQSLYYARRSQNAAENLQAARLAPVIAKYGGVGAHVPYVGAAGPLTFARVMHDVDGLCLLAFTGESVSADASWTRGSCPAWPHLFARFDAPHETILNRLNANHIHAVEGNCLPELESFARMVGIRFLPCNGDPR